jgi:hypothetical protein
MSETKWIQSDLDNRWYLIKSNNITDAQYKENANALAEINKRVELLIDAVKNKYPKLKQLYSPEKLSEAAIDNRYTTFTVDKSDIHVCLRTRNDQKELYDINRLMYVIIHELAHMANWDPKTGEPIIGHGPEFMAIFKDLVKQSISLGIYKWVDYSKSPQEYCGIVIYQNIVN